MSWLTNIPPKIRALVNKPDVPDHLWKQCPGCEQMIFQWAHNSDSYFQFFRVCNNSDHNTHCVRVYRVYPFPGDY